MLVFVEPCMDVKLLREDDNIIKIVVVVVEVVPAIVLSKVPLTILFVVSRVWVLVDEEVAVAIFVGNVVAGFVFDKIIDVTYVVVLVEFFERELVKVVFELELVVVLDFKVTVVVCLVVIVIFFRLLKVVIHQKSIGPVGSNRFLVIIIF